jgi:Transcriptional Coactivator p15 (PC4)
MRQVSAVSAVSAATPSMRNRGRRGAVLPGPVTIAEWWKNRRGRAIRVSLSTYAGRSLIDLRTWYSADGKLQPGKGFAADVRHLPRLAAALAKAVAKATELGLIPTDNGADQ